MRCPVTHSKLEIMTTAQLTELNELLLNGQGQDQTGNATDTAQVDTALINSQRSHAYLIRGGITKLIAEEAIVLRKPKRSR